MRTGISISCVNCLSSHEVVALRAALFAPPNARAFTVKASFAPAGIFSVA